ncbi:hypothetical protein [Actinacidiphila sp. ITFR-21]|uniref:hypothetical protein n=1 Tax=Actinacidiphila sp. ITFR-21 TaxID=3075199 RepID=UPI00288B4890|nr:hypothetical protein [Streptomyces sp. ITFR-21]WNI16901.1 hypothetical protein RLT57_16155 [Streptomyces sp. ITFR-21]
MPLPADRMPGGLRALGERIARLERQLAELRAARRSAVTGAWQELPTAGGWAPAGGSWAAPAVRMEANGVVRLIGSLIPGTLTAGTTVAVLPPGYWPAGDIELRVGGGATTAAADLTLTSAGLLTIQATTGTVTRISLTTLTYPTT